MMMVRPQGLLSKANLLAPRKLLRLRLELIPYWGMPKLLWKMIKLRCEGVEFGVFEHKFYKKYFGPPEASHIS
jgi:hypothetical protein